MTYANYQYYAFRLHYLTNNPIRPYSVGSHADIGALQLFPDKRVILQNKKRIHDALFLFFF